MEFSHAQADVRRAYLNGAPGMFVSGLLWLLTAALVQRGDVTRAMVVLFVGGMFIFPVSALFTRALGGAATLPKGHPMLALAMQSAFIVPVGWPIVVAAGMTREAWYFAAAAVLVAVHYFPFMSLYGMRLFGVLAVALLGGVFASLALAPGSVAASAWSTGAVEVMFACVAMTQWRARRDGQPGHAATSPPFIDRAASRRRGVGAPFVDAYERFLATHELSEVGSDDASLRVRRDRAVGRKVDL